MSDPRVAEIRQALARRARDRGEQFGATFQWFCMERLISRVANHQKSRSRLLLSGDLLVHAICGGEAPCEWEAELHCASSDLEEVAGMLEAICAIDLDDGLEFDPRVPKQACPNVFGKPGAITLSPIARLGPNPCPMAILVRSASDVGGVPIDVPFAATLAGMSSSRPMGRAGADCMADLVLEFVEQGGAARPSVVHNIFRLSREPGIDFDDMPRAIASRRSGAAWRPSAELPRILGAASHTERSAVGAWQTYLNRSRSSPVDLEAVFVAFRRTVLPWIREAAALSAGLGKA